jgi:HK97 gp10 family phage protein
VSVVNVDMSALVSGLRRLGNEMLQRAAAEADMLAAAQPIVDDARSNAPRDPGGRPGFAADTIHSEVLEPHEGEIARVGVGPDETGWYLRFPEFGTSKQPARPWLRPAVDGRMGDFQETLAERLGNRIQRAWSRG